MPGPHVSAEQKDGGYRLPLSPATPAGVVFDPSGELDGSAGGESFSLVIGPAQGWSPMSWLELWQYRGLLYFLMWRDIKLRYKQTALGASWAILQPLLITVIFSVIFGHFAHIPSDGVPYPIFSYCALVPWTLFAYALSQASASLVANSELVSRVYFPRLIIPLAAGLAGLLDCGVSLILLAGMMMLYGIHPTVALVALPAFLLLATLAALGAGIWLAALNVRYRDVRFAIPFLIQVWLYATPIAYPAGLVTGKLHLVLALNPMTGVVEGFRWAVLGKSSLDGTSLILSTLVTLAGLALGLVYFHRTERSFADVV